MKALAALEPWLKQGASSDLKNPGAELATGISTFFRYVTTPLAQKYGGGESGLARFLKDSTARINADPKAPFSDEETKFLDSVLLAAWEQSSGSGRETGRSRSATAVPTDSAGSTAWTVSAHGSGVRPRRAADHLDGQTIHSQGGQSYCGCLHDVDSARSIADRTQRPVEDVIAPAR